MASSTSAVANMEPGSPPAPLSRPPTTIASTTATIAFPIALGTKYAREAYLSKYTVTVGGATRPIVGIDDLRDYNVRQSEFRELHVLGDVSQRYPSIARLFFGSLSRVIVAIPTRYVIQRNSDSCAAGGSGPRPTGPCPVSRPASSVRARATTGSGTPARRATSTP